MPIQFLLTFMTTNGQNQLKQMVNSVHLKFHRLLFSTIKHINNNVTTITVIPFYDQVTMQIKNHRLHYSIAIPAGI